MGGLIKNTVGVLAHSVAKDAFEAEKESTNLGEKVAFKDIGSVATAVAYQVLKEEVIEVAREIRKS